MPTRWVLSAIVSMLGFFPAWNTNIQAQAHPCTDFSEDFSGSPTGWTAANGTWNFQSQKLVVTSIPQGKLAYAQKDFRPSDFFAIDVAVELAAFPSNASVGIYPWTTGDFLFSFEDNTADGLGAIYFGNRTAALFGWNPVAGQWFVSNAVNVSGTVTSIGVAYSEDAVTLRINGQNTTLRANGFFSLAPMVLDRLWLTAEGASTTIRFDNVCAGPLVDPISYLLSVNKAGSGSGVVTSSLPGINCGGDCSEYYPSGTSVTLSAVPASGSVFGGWSGGCTGTSTCVVNMTMAKTITATFNLVPVDSPPTVSITSPSAGATVNGTVTIQANATDDKGISKVEFYVDGAKKTEKTSAPYTYAWDSRTVSNGSHTLKVRALDTASQVREAQISVTVSNATADTPPSVSISSPTNGATVSGTINVVVNATDDKGVTKVEFFVDGAKKSEKTAAPYSFSWNTTTVGNGLHTVRAKAWDTASKTAEAYNTVTVSNGGTVGPAGTTTVLYFPFCQADAVSLTGFAVSNYSALPAQLQFTAYSTAGQQLYPTSVFQLQSHNQLAQLSTEIFSRPAGSNQTAWVELISDNPEIGSFFQFGAANQLDGSVPLETTFRTLYFTRVFEGNTGFRGQPAETWISMANPTQQSVTVELRLIAPGTAAVVRSRSIPARGFIYERVWNLFGLSAPVTSAFVKATVTAGSGVVGFELVKLTKQGTVIGLNAQPAGTATSLYSAQLASLTGLFTNVKLVNTGSQSIRATLTPTDAQGNLLGTAVQRDISAGGILEEDVTQTFGWAGSAVKVGSLKIEANRAGLVGDVIFGDSAKLISAAALPLQTQKLTRGIFSQVANIAGLFTGLAFYNPGGERADVTLRVYSEQGTKTGEKSFSLLTGERVSQLLTEWMPSTSGQVKGYVEVISTQPLIAQQLFGSAALLSAVPPTVSPTVVGPGGVTVSLPPAVSSWKSSMTLSSDTATSIVETGEKAVSGAVRVGLSGGKTFQGSQPIQVEIPVTGGTVDPQKLYAKVKLTSGFKLPVLGRYDSTRRIYTINIFGFVHGWVLGVVEGKKPNRLLPTETGGAQPAATQTPMQWKTFDWEIVNETKEGTLSNDKIERDLRPLLRDIGIAYQSTGFRSPRLWYDTQTNLPRIYFIEKGGGDSGFYAPCPNNLCDSTDPVFAVSTQAGKEGMLLGSIYIDYRSYLDGVATQGMNLDYLIAHEMFHSVQAGYDVKQSVEKGVGNRDWSTITCYEEGTADLMGMTYQVRGNTLGPGPALVGPASPDDLWGKRAWLNDPLDDYRVSWPYTRRDFFAFLAKRYFSNQGVAYQHEFWNALSAAADVDTSGLAPASFLPLYRKGLDNFLRANGCSLPQAYFEFAFERAFNHTADYFLYPAEENDPSLTPKSLAVPLFSGNTGIKPWENPMGSPLVFSTLKPLTTVATTIDVPTAYKDKIFPLLFKVENGEPKELLDEEGIAILIFRESWGQLVSQNPSIVVTDFSRPVEIQIDQDISHLTVLIMNCYVQQKEAKVTLQVADEADKLWLRIGADEQDPSLPVWWSHFAPWDNVFSMRDYLPEVDAKGMDLRTGSDGSSFPFELSWSKSTADNATADYRVSGTGQILANAMPPGYIPTPGASLEGTWTVVLNWASSNGLITEQYEISGTFKYQGVYDITGIATPIDGYDPLFTQNSSEGNYTATGTRVEKNDKGEVTLRDERTITGKTHQFLVYLKREQSN